MSVLKKLAGIATAVAALFTVGCHPEPKCYYGPAPGSANGKDELENNDIKPEVLDTDDTINKPNYRGNPAHSNEALDVYGPPPMDLDDPDINPDMLEEPEPDEPTIDDYKKPKDAPPEIVALYGVRMEKVDK